MRSSSTLSILSQYSPRIQIMEALDEEGGRGEGGRESGRVTPECQGRGGVANLASGSSRESRFSQRVEMMLSYWLGYLRKISCRKDNVAIRHDANGLPQVGLKGAIAWVPHRCSVIHNHLNTSSYYSN